MIAAAVAGVGILAALLVIGLVPRHEQTEELNADAAAAENAPVLVNIAKPVRAAETVQITIPGTLRPWQEVSIYARTAGYLKKFYVDISNQVEAGQLLAEIDTPEVNQELRQSQAALLQTKAAVTKATADRDLAKVTWGRYQQLAAPNYVSQQEADEKQAALHVAESALEAAAGQRHRRRGERPAADRDAELPEGLRPVRRRHHRPRVRRRLADHRQPHRDRRQADVQDRGERRPPRVRERPAVGVAADHQGDGRQGDRPRAAGPLLRGQGDGHDQLPRPGQPLAADGGEGDQRPRARGRVALLPGMYVQVSFEVKRTTPPLVVPGPAVVNDAQGTQVAVVRGDGTAHFQKVTLGQDFGKEVEIVEGLTGNEQVITNPGERIVEGAVVRASGGEGNPGGGQHDKVAAAAGK